MGSDNLFTKAQIERYVVFIGRINRTQWQATRATLHNAISNNIMPSVSTWPNNIRCRFYERPIKDLSTAMIFWFLYGKNPCETISQINEPNH